MKKQNDLVLISTFCLALMNVLGCDEETDCGVEGCGMDDGIEDAGTSDDTDDDGGDELGAFLSPQGDEFMCDTYSFPEVDVDVWDIRDFERERPDTCDRSRPFVTLFTGRLIDSQGEILQGSAAICSDISEGNTICLRPVFTQEDGSFQIQLSPEDATCPLGFKFRAYAFDHGHAVYYDYLERGEVRDGLYDLGGIILPNLPAAETLTQPPAHDSAEPFLPEQDVSVTFEDGLSLEFNYADIVPLMLPSQPCWSYSALSAKAFEHDMMPPGLKETAPFEFDRVWAFSPEIDFLEGADAELPMPEGDSVGDTYVVYVVGGLAVSPIPGSEQDFDEGKWTQIAQGTADSSGKIILDGPVPALTWLGIKKDQ